MVSNLIKPYFPRLTALQAAQFDALPELYDEWNAQINVISRKDISTLPHRHILHSLAIARFIDFRAGSHILDLGTGGGFPGIPLAILFPEVRFHLVDSVGKKIKVVEGVASSIGIQNVVAEHKRAEELKAKYDFVVSRAVAGIDKLVAWSSNLISTKQLNAMPNGIIALKGGDPKLETKLLKKGTFVEIVGIKEYFFDDSFEGKYLLYLPL